MFGGSILPLKGDKVIGPSFTRWYGHVEARRSSLVGNYCTFLDGYSAGVLPTRAASPHDRIGT